MSEPKDLAGRYRGLLGWYPRDHRERHGEEMLGVLLAGAGDRTRPSRGETADLLLGALRLHARRVVGADGGIDHRDVLAIVSLLGPVMMLAGAAAVVDKAATVVQLGMWAAWIHDFTPAPVWATWFVVALLSLFRMRRTAAVGAWLGTAGFLVVPWIDDFYYIFYLDTVIADVGWLLLGAVVAAALTWSPGPARGWELVSGRRVAVLAVAVVASVVLVMKSLDTWAVLRFPAVMGMEGYWLERVVPWFLASAVLAVGAYAAAGVRTREGRRAALVLCVPAMACTLMFLLPHDVGHKVALAVGAGVPLALLVVFAGLPRRRARLTGGTA
ncbi:hypothetical protein [Actinophytocola sp. KF-1]